MIRYPVAYVAALLAMLAFDTPWLVIAGRYLYKPELGPLLLDRPKLGAALAFYLTYGVGVLVLAIAPGWDEETSARTLVRGAVLGLVAYATYDFTNLATLRGWSVTVTWVDLIWGTVLTAIAACAGRIAARFLFA